MCIRDSIDTGHRRLDLSVLQAADDAERAMSMMTSHENHLATATAAVDTCVTGEDLHKFLLRSHRSLLSLLSRLARCFDWCFVGLLTQ